MILSVSKVKGKTLLNCSEYEGDFKNAKSLKIVDSNKKVLETKSFVLEKTRACFSKGGAPWILLKEDVPENFLHKGNQIILQ